MIGARLGPYQIGRELGSGGMGKVYAATGPAGVVALKVVHAHLLETPGFFKRFMREAQLGQSIRHENVVRTIDCDQQVADGHAQAYLVMEYVEGQTLAGLLAELVRVPEELCRHVAQEICKGLAALHDAGVVHRDLKPENVLITADHVVKVMDLGIAKLADEAMRLSKSGAFVGSVEYAAPEQFKGGAVDGRTDLHALGVLLYELSSGQHPYRGEGFHEVLSRICNDAPRRLGEVHPQLSAFFEEVVHTLLAKDPQERFASATQLLCILGEGESSAWWRGRSRALQTESRRPIRRIRIPRETAVYGRDAEIAKLRGLLDRANSGDGQVVLIEGEAGIGKSRLVDELITRLQADGADLHFLFGSYPPGGAATADGGFSSAFREQFGESGSAAYLPENQILVPAFDALLRGEGAPSGAQALTSGSLQTCFVRATQSLAAERTTVVLIDDLHFAPDEGRALFSSLALAVPGHRVLLIGSTRPGVSEAWRAGLTRLAQVTSMAVQRLGPKDLVALLAESLGSEHLAEELAGRIAAKSDGNPFFAFEIIRGLREGQFITQKADGTWATTRAIGEIQIPSSILDLVNARVAGLSEEARNVLDVAACWGFEFDPLLVGEVLGMNQIPLMRLLAHVEKKDRLVRSAGRRFVFDHHQVQEALYAAMPELLREPYHAALADALASRTKAAEKDLKDLDGALCVDLCRHYLSGARGEAAVRYLPAAQRHLNKGYLAADVASLTERALQVPDLLKGTERAKTLLVLAAALDTLGRRARQEECSREAESLAEAAGDDVLRGEATTALGGLHLAAGRYAEAAATCRLALDRARARRDKGAEIEAVSRSIVVLLREGRFSEARKELEAAHAIASEHGDPRLLDRVTWLLAGVLRSQGEYPAAREHFERALRTARETRDRQLEVLAQESLGLVCIGQGRLREARQNLEPVIAFYREVGNRLREAAFTANLANVCMKEGRLLDARVHQERAIAIQREIGDRQGESIARVNSGQVWYLLGDRVRAREALEASLATCREIGARLPEGYALHFLGILADEEGDAGDGLRLLEESLALRRQTGFGTGVSDSLITMAQVRLGSGDDARDPVGVRTLLEESLELTRQQARAEDSALILALLARLPGGDAEAASRALAELGADGDAVQVRWNLWLATRDREHLAATKRMLDSGLAKIPAEHHAAMLSNVRLNREIMAAWRAEGGAPTVDAGPGGDEPRGTESADWAGP